MKDYFKLIGFWNAQIEIGMRYVGCWGPSRACFQVIRMICLEPCVMRVVSSHFYESYTNKFVTSCIGLVYSIFGCG